MLKLIVTALTLLIIWPACSANAADIELAVGRSQFTVIADGNWYQDPFPHSINLVSPSIAIGITDYVTDAIRYHAGYRYLGAVRSDAQAVASDPYYHKYGADAAKYLKLGRWTGYGSVNMIYASLAPEYRANNGITYSVEFELSVYRPTWTEDVTDVQQDVGLFLQNFHFEHDPRLEIAKAIGFGIKYESTQLLIQYYLDINAAGDAIPAIYKGSVINVSLIHTF